MSAFQQELEAYRRRNVQVLGISIDHDLNDTAKWAEDIGVSFPLLSDAKGEVSKRFDMFNSETRTSSRAVALIANERLIHSEIVNTTEIPHSVLPTTLDTITTA